MTSRLTWDGSACGGLDVGFSSHMLGLNSVAAYMEFNGSSCAAGADSS
jgi:hypothetical protein